MAYPDVPNIPAQRAMIVFRDGVETLIVESTIQTPSQEIGWVLPLPAEPTKLDVADPGLLTSMAYAQGPRITARAQGYWQAPVVASLFVIPIAISIAFVTDPRRRRGLIWRSVAIVWFLMLLHTLLLSSVGGVGTQAISGVQISATQRLGSYRATVLRADSSDALDRWLTAEGLRGLDAADRKAADDYIARKWCFVVARLRKDAAEATPHPIMATFPVAAPVYPMKGPRLLLMDQTLLRSPVVQTALELSSFKISALQLNILYQV
ncbi:hypothetical protein LCGC14_2175770 [marine sediment metagenome]|uniref:DUF2330 domain-containing protein n=1 Tax=marine sediment metagenome TaxID=412755 RepID=A0A0F9G1E3_9ZZZZ